LTQIGWCAHMGATLVAGTSCRLRPQISLHAGMMLENPKWSIKCRALNLPAFACVLLATWFVGGAAAAQQTLTIERLIADGWDVAGYVWAAAKPFIDPFQAQEFQILRAVFCSSGCDSATHCNHRLLRNQIVPMVFASNTGIPWIDEPVHGGYFRYGWHGIPADLARP
jgi:hypothetical protein